MMAQVNRDVVAPVNCNDPRAPPSHYRHIRPLRGLIQALSIRHSIYHRKIAENLKLFHNITQDLKVTSFKPLIQNRSTTSQGSHLKT